MLKAPQAFAFGCASRPNEATWPLPGKVAIGTVELAYHRRQFDHELFAPSADGRSIVWVQHCLGHGSPEVTLRVYSHFMPRPDDELDFLDNVTPIQRQTVA